MVERDHKKNKSFTVSDSYVEIPRQCPEPRWDSHTSHAMPAALSCSQEGRTESVLRGIWPHKAPPLCSLAL